jgi:small subunit ribosomal protein S2
MKITTLPTLRELFEAGVHFGHKKQNSDARGRDNFFGVKNKVVVINLEKTRQALEKALSFIGEQAAEGATFLFVGTKNQARQRVEEVAKKLGMPYVTNRWLGGTLTNFDTIKKSIKKLEDIESELADATKSERRTKKETILLKREVDRIKYNLSGMQAMKKLPQVIIVVDTHEESSAVKEAIKLNIPTVAILDTNANPKEITYPIPANDDTPKSINMIMGFIEETIANNYRPTETQEASATPAVPASAAKTAKATQEKPKTSKAIKKTK